MGTAYKCRAYPDPEQAAIFGRTFGCVRLVWNKTLAERHRAWHSHGRRTSYKETDAALTAWKKTEELAFLSEVSSVPLQQALRHQHAAFAGFFAGRARYPRFKTRTSRQSAHYTRSAFRMRDGELQMAKAISDCGWGEFRRQLEYKAHRAGRTLIVIDRWYPSSKTCSNCGHLLEKLSPSTRHWTCPGCRTRHDRDHNAAKNILAAGRAAAGARPGEVCGADVRRQGSPLPQSATKQKPPRREPRESPSFQGEEEVNHALWRGGRPPR
ncbi:RNA-guided endonuclease InsQ/TnpB family protein [Actinomadura bangladeshensis]|uniref:RNA-guided endonuclease InsQ/TnpB family protein n=1 Tax=Actinomadura bangladeshensis TaxID=453573 RepID=UPI001FB58740|nr:RNA-guided endonuclease TnpB family protein [Actinomadura bangladeshensis]